MTKCLSPAERVELKSVRHFNSCAETSDPRARVGTGAALCLMCNPDQTRNRTAEASSGSRQRYHRITASVYRRVSARVLCARDQADHEQAHVILAH